MPGFSSGGPNERDYNLGRGIVRFAKLAASGLPDANGFRDLGNAPEFNINISQEDVRHQSSREQLKFTDKRCTISQEIGLSFQLDELNTDNLADFLSGTTETFDNQAITATWLATASLVVDGGTTPFKIGNWYQLKDDNGVRVYELNESTLVYGLVEDPAGTPVTLVAGTDYEIDEAMGLVRFLSGGPATLTSASVIGFAVTTGATTAQDLPQVNALKTADVVGALLFIATNACDQGNKSEYLFHKASLSADGDLALIGDEITTMSFTGVAEVNNGVPDTSKVLTVRTYDQQATA